MSHPLLIEHRDGADWVTLNRPDSLNALDPSLIDALNASGAGIVGTPEAAIAHLERLVERSGGFGTFLIFGPDWANRQDTMRSYELFAREVIPHFDDSMPSRLASFARAKAREARDGRIRDVGREKARAAYYESNSPSGNAG